MINKHKFLWLINTFFFSCFMQIKNHLQQKNYKIKIY
jgi:hypothetical protein